MRPPLQSWIVFLYCGLKVFLASFLWQCSASLRSFDWDISIWRFRSFDSWFGLLGSAINLVNFYVPRDLLQEFLSIVSTAVILPVSNSYQKLLRDYHFFETLRCLAEILLLQNSCYFSRLSWYIWQVLVEFPCPFSPQKSNHET